MITENQIADLNGRDVYGSDGEKIGRVGEVYLDDDTGRPEWVTINTGLLGTKTNFAPLANAEVTDNGLTVPFDKTTVKDAPNVDPDNGHLSRDEERGLYEYYGLPYSKGSDTRSVGRDTSGPVTDDAMTRSEERLNVGTRTEEAGRARLRKYVVTEQQSVQVPVTREEVRLEREPITDKNVDRAVSGPEISEEEHEVTLHEERPVVTTEAQPVERVRLSKETVTDQETVSGEVRKEQIEADGVDKRR
jgi:uncharacterized protein (TIGR02271 family)